MNDMIMFAIFALVSVIGAIAVPFIFPTAKTFRSFLLLMAVLIAISSTVNATLHAGYPGDIRNAWRTTYRFVGEVRLPGETTNVHLAVLERADTGDVLQFRICDNDFPNLTRGTLCQVVKKPGGNTIAELK